MTEQANSVSLIFSRSEALVLFEWLHRLEDAGDDLTRVGFQDQAEQRVLWDMSACLERALIEPVHAITTHCSTWREVRFATQPKMRDCRSAFA